MDNTHIQRLELDLRPIGLRAANAFVAAITGTMVDARHKFSISVIDAQARFVAS